MATKKIKINYLNQEFLLPENALQKDSYDGGNYIYMGAKHCASVIKQYVTKNHPSIKVWATSDVYSGGSSTRINISNHDGSSVSDKINEDVKSFANSLKGGKFDGMYDIYEYREDSVSTENGTPLKYFPSYVFIENRPKWGTVEYWISQWNEYKESNNSEWIEQIQRVGGWFEYNKEFMDKKIMDKVASLTVNS